MNIKNAVKEKAVKVKNWVVDHKGVVIAGAAGLLCGGLYLKHKLSSDTDDTESYDELPDSIDYGRDMHMQFVYDDTGEQMEGSVPCTEMYAKEMIEDMEEYETEE